MRFTFSLFPPRISLRQDLPENATIKKTAHALTILAAAWIGVSVFAIVAYKVGKEDSDPSWVSAAIWAWRIHAAIIALAIVFWVCEKPSEVRYLADPKQDEDA